MFLFQKVCNMLELIEENDVLKELIKEKKLSIKINGGCSVYGVSNYNVFAM